MAVKAIVNNYTRPKLDVKENFGGKIIVYIGWDEHLLFCSAKAFPLSPEMSFSDVRNGVLAEGFGQHPDFANIDWTNVEWSLNGEAFTPDDSKSLEDQGFDHKSLLRFRTLGLNGYKGMHV